MNVLSAKTAEWLLKVSRQSIEYFLETKNFLPYESLQIPIEVNEEAEKVSGAFVLLELQQNELHGAYIRGENGVFEQVEGLGKLVTQVSVNAAFFDPQYPRLKNYELNEIRIHILIPSEKQQLHGTYDEVSQKMNENTGFLLESRGRVAYDLPNILTAQSETIEQRLRRLRLRLGGKWKNVSKDVSFYTFSVQHYSEEML